VRAEAVFFFFFSEVFFIWSAFLEVDLGKGTRLERPMPIQSTAKSWTPGMDAIESKLRKNMPNPAPYPWATTTGIGLFLDSSESEDTGGPGEKMTVFIVSFDPSNAVPHSTIFVSYFTFKPPRIFDSAFAARSALVGNQLICAYLAASQ